jgi:hypothetical protein
MTRQFVEQAFSSSTWGNTKEVPEDWLKILEGKETNQRRQLFEKIFREDSSGALTKKLFSPDEIKRYLKDLDRPFYRQETERRRLVWRSVYLGENASIPELAWVILRREKD